MSGLRDMAESVYKAAVPVNARIFLDTAVRGVRTPITEADFSVEELNQLRAAYRTAASRTQQREADLKAQLAMPQAEYEKNPERRVASAPRMGEAGQVTFRDVPYGERQADLQRKLASFENTRDRQSVDYQDYPLKPAEGMGVPVWDNTLRAVAKSYTDPSYRMRTTLGTFKVIDTPNGKQAVDTYDFDNRGYYEGVRRIPVDKVGVKELWKRSTGPVEFLDMMMIKHQPNTRRDVRINLGE